MADEVFDVAIIGAGPGGSSAALTLARHGRRVVLFEAHHMPHPKVCGEFLSPECADLLEVLAQKKRIQTLEPVTIQSIRMTAPRGTVWDYHLPRPGWAISRSSFDAALAEGAAEAGALFLDGTQVTEVNGGLSRGFVLKTGRGVFRTRTVLASHGKRAVLDRQLNRAFMHRPQPFLAIKAHFSGPTLENRVELHAFSGGYCGLTNVEGDRRNVCLLVREGIFRRISDRSSHPVEAFVAWMRAQNPHLDHWLTKAERIDLHWQSIAQIPFGRKATHAGDILMVGDAAGLIAPLAGDGIAMALQSGRMAGAQIDAFLAGKVCGEQIKRDYAAQWQREFGLRVRLGQVLQSLLLEPSLASFGLRALRWAPSVGDYLVRHTRDSRTTWPKVGP